MASMIAKQNKVKPDSWVWRHNTAVARAIHGANVPLESPLARMLESWAEYAKGHKARFESTIGEDYVLGPQWQAIGEGIRGLLNGETGRLDCGTLDGFILDTLSENGIDIDNL